MGETAVISGMAIDSLLGTSYREVEARLRSGYTDFFVDPWLVERKARCALRSGWYKRPRYTGEDLGAARDLLERFSPETVDGLAVLRPLVEDARLTPEVLESPRTGVIGAAESALTSLSVEHDAVFRAEQPAPLRTLGPYAVDRAQLNGLATAFAAILGTRGASFALETACCTAAYGLALATHLVRSGRQDRVIVAFANTRSMAHATFDPLRALATWDGEPNTACRPFDRRRCGVVLGGGVAALLVESRRAAERRGAPIYAEVAGVAIGSDGYDWTNSNGIGSVEVMEGALAEAGLTPDQVGYVNAHGTSTPVGDIKEAVAIHEVFGGRPVPVSSTKSQEGHLVLAAALTELYYSIVMLREGFIAATINVDEPDPELPPGFDLVTSLREAPFDALLKNSFGFGGTNASIALRRAR